jgi:hypothetical protein
MFRHWIVRKEPEPLRGIFYSVVGIAIVAQAVVRSDHDSKCRYICLAMHRKRSIAKVAMGRRLAVRSYQMWRE